MNPKYRIIIQWKMLTFFFSLDLTRTGGLDSAMAIQREAERHLVSLIPKVCESDLEVATLEQQVRELRTIMTAQRHGKRLTVNGENCARGVKESSPSTEKTEANKFGINTPHSHSDHNPISYVSPLLFSILPSNGRQRICRCWRRC